LHSTTTYNFTIYTAAGAGAGAGAGAATQYLGWHGQSHASLFLLV